MENVEPERQVAALEILNNIAFVSNWVFRMEDAKTE